jgi:hypothetical protein
MSLWEVLLHHRGGGGRSVDWPVTIAAAVAPMLLRHSLRGGGGAYRVLRRPRHTMYMSIIRHSTFHKTMLSRNPDLTSKSPMISAGV